MKWSKRLYASVAFMGAITTVMAFQNCGPTSSGSIYPTQDEKVAAMAKAMPFAYDGVLDNFSYMSCAVSQNTAALATYYTFKMGAFGGGGLGLNSYARNYLLTKVPDDAQRLKVFQASPANASLAPQLDIRNVSNLMGASESSQNTGRGLTYDYMLDFLQLSWIVDTLFKSPSGTYIKQVTDPYTKQIKKMQGQLTFFRDEGGHTALRNSFSADNPNLIALSFTQADNKGGGAPAMPDSINPEGFGRIIFGRGFRPRFIAPELANAVWGQRLVSELEERNLEHNTSLLSASRTWSCEPAMRFMIVRNKDMNTDLNVRLPNETSTVRRRISGDNDGGDPDRMRLIRNSLPEDRWFVDIPNRLIAPKLVGDGSCYQNEQSVSYDIADGTCDSGSPGGTFFKACAHFVSICYRN